MKVGPGLLSQEVGLAKCGTNNLTLRDGEGQPQQSQSSKTNTSTNIKNYIQSFKPITKQFSKYTNSFRVNIQYYIMTIPPHRDLRLTFKIHIFTDNLLNTL